MPRQASADEALAAVAHGLRLPLSHIKGFVSASRRTDVKRDQERLREYLAEIDFEAAGFEGQIPVQSEILAIDLCPGRTPGDRLSQRVGADTVERDVERLPADREITCTLEVLA